MKTNKMTLSAIARTAGRSKSGISRILHRYNITNSFKSPRKAEGRPPNTNAGEERIMWRSSVDSRFNIAAGSARDGEDVSRHTVSTFNRIWTERPLCRDQTPHQQKESKTDLC